MAAMFTFRLQQSTLSLTISKKSDEASQIFLLLVVSNSHRDGQNNAFDFLIECEKHFERTIDQNRLRVVVIAEDDVCYHSAVPRASFILIPTNPSDPDHHQDRPEDYPELATRLPFQE